MKSLKELYRIGKGPSSSHTMGPASAAAMFRSGAPDAVRYRVELYGSLAATGRGHMTDRAVISELGEDRTEVVWKPEVVPSFHPNGLRIFAYDAAGAVVRDQDYYSVGGGTVSVGGKSVGAGRSIASPICAKFSPIATAKERRSGQLSMSLRSKTSGITCPTC